ncbi:MAG: hypothetical protein R3C17_05205 [Planctomycetaceae bacterium]
MARSSYTSAAVRSHVNASRHTAQQFESACAVSIDMPLPVSAFQERGFHDSRQSGNQRPIDECNRMVNILQTFILRQRLQLLPEFSDDFFQAFRIEDRGGFQTVIPTRLERGETA